MALKKSQHFVRGMQRDLSVSKFNPEFAFDCQNIRITARENNTLLTVTNEKGNKELLITPDPEGKPISRIFVSYRVTEGIHEALFSFSNNPPVPFELFFNFILNGELVSTSIEVTQNPAYPMVYRFGSEGVVTDAWVIDSEDKYTYTFNDSIAIAGTLLGYCTIGNYYVAFTQDKLYSRIYRIKITPEGEATGVLLYQGNLNFNTDYPIETLGVYENEEIQKVYWVDGLNQPRVINIVAPQTVRNTWYDGSFNFVQNLSLNDSISVSRQDDASGFFSSGVIQYAFSYYNKYGQESNIFYTTPLQYISFSSRGASPEDKVSCSFQITIDYPDKRFDYLRIYSIHRTSIDATPTVLNVVDLDTSGGLGDKDTLIYTDDGTKGTTVDPTELLYIGGESVVFGTMAQKDNTLFLGNANIQREIISQEVIDLIRGGFISFGSKRIGDNISPSGFYPYKNTLYLGSAIKSFKYREWYRFGIQFQHRTGKWSEPIWITDSYNSSTAPSFDGYLSLVRAVYRVSADIINKVVAQGYIRARGVVVYPDLTDREVVLQGVICPTVFNVGDRYSNSPFVQSSWFARPNLAFDIEKSGNNWAFFNTEGGNWKDYTDTPAATIHNNNLTLIVDESAKIPIDLVNKGAWAEFRHNYPIPNNWERNAEIQCIADVPTKYSERNGELAVYTDKVGSDLTSYVSTIQEYFFVDQSILTMHSPEIEFDDNVKNMDGSKLKLRIVGVVPMTANASDIDIQTSTPSYGINQMGFYKEFVGSENNSHHGHKSLIAGAYWFDKIYKTEPDTDLTEAFAVYPWHRNGPLNNQDHVTEGTRSAMLDKKKISNLKFSSFTNYFTTPWEAYIEGDQNHTGITPISIFDSNEQTLIRIPAPENSYLGDLSYYGNVDKVITPTRTNKEYTLTYEFENGNNNPIKRSLTFNRKEGYPIVGTNIGDASLEAHKLFTMDFLPIAFIFNSDESPLTLISYSTDPVRMKYKSSPHIVFSFNYTTNHNQVVLPTTRSNTYIEGWSVNPIPTHNYGNLHSFWDPRAKAASDPDVNIASNTYQDVIGSYNSSIVGDNYGYLFMAELYRDAADVPNRFGGTSEEAFENNIWLPAGNPVSLITGYDNQDNPVPSEVALDVEFTEGDTFLERYDCLKTYSYTLEDQNSVTDIVSFMCETRVNIEGRYDRNRGQLSNLTMTPENFNKLNPVYNQRNNFFNYRGLNHSRFSLNYFPNTITWTKQKQLGSLIDAWTNITMASTLDLDGDKGEVVSLNTYNNNIYCFQKQGFSNILYNSREQIPVSDGVPIEITNGLKVSGKRYISNSIGCSNKWSIVESPAGIYFVDNETNSLYVFNNEGINSLSDKLGFRQWINAHNVHVDWDPVNFSNYRSFYDKNNNDVYFTYEDHCLCYSELLGQFTSFMSYEKVPSMFNISSEFFAFKDNKLWHQFAGDYNTFFGYYKPYSITLISNAEEPLDKIFNNLEFRADSWDGDTLIDNVTFDTLEVWNEYQSGKVSLTNKLGYPSSLKKKFRIWRANIPRDSKNKRDRIRNPWAYIKLSMNTPNTFRTEFHDAVVHYFA